MSAKKLLTNALGARWWGFPSSATRQIQESVLIEIGCVIEDHPFLG